VLALTEIHLVLIKPSRTLGPVCAVAFASTGCGARTPLDGPSYEVAETGADSAVPQQDATIDVTRLDTGPPDLDAPAPDAPGPDTAPSLCERACPIGQATCDDGGVSSCVADDAGCGTWAPPVACAPSSICVGADGGGSCHPVDVEPPRPVAPLSTARVTSHRPVFHWALAGQDDGAQVDICHDRACTTLETSFTATGTSSAPGQPLAPGVHFWRLHGTEGPLVGAATSVVWEVFVPVRDTPVNTSWGTTLDIDGDGFADLAASGADATSEFVEVYVCTGSATGVATSPVKLTIPSNEYQAVVQSAGDVNGDGYGDLLVATPSSGGLPGSFLVFPGGPGWATAPPAVVPAPAGVLELGTSAQSVGDVNGDGYGDLLLSAVTQQDGALDYLYLGGPAGPSLSPRSFSAAKLVAPALATDVNGDGLSDVIIGVVGGPGGTSDEVDVYLGTPAGPSTAPIVLGPYPNPPTGWFYVRVTSGGDLNGDGYGDILVALEPTEPGWVDVYMGSASGLSAAPIAIQAPTVAGVIAWGIQPAGVGDIDGDGYDDVMLGVRGPTEGFAYVYRGGAAGVSTTPTATLQQPATSQGQFADPVMGIGDVNGDGFADVAIGQYSGSDELFYYPGSAVGLPATPIIIAGPAGVGAFGDSIAIGDAPWCTEGGQGT